ncbi:MAG: prepilin peptidase [Hyphomicrobiaceae bacterium]
MTAATLMILTQLVYVFCVSYAIVSDLRRLIIPNWIPVALAVTFPIFALVHAGLDRIPAHLAIAAVVFLISLIFFVADWMGGGDIKLLAALMLWVGPGTTPEFLVVMSLLGAMLAIALMIVRSFSSTVDPWGQIVVVRRIVELARLGQCPYGVAIGLSALIYAPKIFGFA